MHACRTRCPVQPECERWSLALPLNDSAVYAGLSQAERRRRRAVLNQITRRALADGAEAARCRHGDAQVGA